MFKRNAILIQCNGINIAFFPRLKSVRFGIVGNKIWFILQLFTELRSNFDAQIKIKLLITVDWGWVENPQNAYLSQIARYFVAVLPRIDPSFRCVAIEHTIRLCIRIGCARMCGVGHGCRWHLSHASHRIAAELIGFFAQQFIECFDKNEHGIIHQCSLCLINGNNLHDFYHNVVEWCSRRNSNLW